MRGARRSSLGKDVAKALGYSNTSKTIQQHVDKKDKGTLPFWETAYETRTGTGSGKAFFTLHFSLFTSRLGYSKP